MGSLTFLNEHGDVTLMWDASADDKVKAIVEKKMKEGYTFFIIKPRQGGLIAPEKLPAKNVKEAMKQRALAISDDDFVKMVEANEVTAFATPPEKIEDAKVSRDPAEVAKSESVAVRHKRGG